ncbi:MAG: methyltransferase domain-containing protein [Campylobacterota bacterium]|nr:methyltransferase domain-containing protein [Campylobacterota bacterium]
MIKELAIKNQFSKYANEYNSNNIIQQIVSKALVREIVDKPKRILELGCGSGQVFKNIDFKYDYYKAIDFSQVMCDIHPTAQNLEIVCLDFDSEEFFYNIKDEKYDLILSSSALQWSKNLPKIIKALSKISNTVNMVLFTSNTFKTIFELTNRISPILELETIKNSFTPFYNCDFEVLNYKLEFDNKKELFSYIKNSGVSGETNSLSFKDAKYLYKNYDKNYLEFEVVFINGVKNV